MIDVAPMADGLPEGFEPFVLEFIGTDRNSYSIPALRVVDSEWCAHPRIHRGCICEDEWFVSHISGLKISTWPLVKFIALDAARHCADLHPNYSHLSEDERRAINTSLKQIIGEAESRDPRDAADARRSDKGEAHA